MVNYGLAPAAPHPALTPVPDASHTRNRLKSPPDSRCLAGTRKKVLERIRPWALDGMFKEALDHPLHYWANGRPISTSKHVLWLCGPVGCGKSAISQTLAEEFEEEGLLLGSFFCFRGSGDRSRIAGLLVTLASQMADAIPETCPLVEDALRGSFGLHAASPKTKFHRLICKPLRAVILAAAVVEKSGNNGLGKRPRSAIAPRGPFLAIIDGFDECDNRDKAAGLIDEIFDFFERSPSDSSV